MNSILNNHFGVFRLIVAFTLIFISSFSAEASPPKLLIVERASEHLSAEANLSSQSPIGGLNIKTLIDARDIKVDGKLSEPIWEKALLVKGLKVLDPDTLRSPAHSTEVKLLASPKGLFVGFVNAQDKAQQVTRLSSRDSDVSRDSVSIAIDSYGNGNSGYLFELALGDTKTDGTITPEREISNDWDGPWQGASFSTESHWYAEIFLPWTMFSFANTGLANQQFTIYFERKVSYLGETWGWPSLPESRGIFLTGFADVNSPALPSSSNYAFYPYISGSHDFLNHDQEGDVGFDLFWQPISSSQLALTVNPDFSQIEADDLVVNLTTSETFLSEKRAFFLERQDLFNTGNSASTSKFNMLNTRKIGASSEGSPIALPSDILFASKLTGKVDKLSYGWLSAKEDDTDFNENSVLINEDGRSFHALRLSAETNIGGHYNDIGVLSTYKEHPDNRAEVSSIDGHGRFLNNNLSIALQFINSHVETEANNIVTQKNGNGFASYLHYSAKNGDKHKMKLESYEDDFDVSDLGYLRRSNYTGLEYGLSHNKTDNKFYKNVNSYWWYLSGFNSDHRLVYASVLNTWTLTTFRQNTFTLSAQYNPARWEDRLAAFTYKMEDRPWGSIAWQTDKSKQHSASIKAGLNTEGTHHVTQYTELSYRFLPNYRFALDAELDYTRYNSTLRNMKCLDQLSSETAGCLVAADAEQWKPSLAVSYFFSAKQQLKLSLQALTRKDYGVHRYGVTKEGKLVAQDQDVQILDSGVNSMAFQVKYRHEVGPLSDFYVVYARDALLFNLFESAGENLSASFDQPKEEKLTLKLRYRFSG